jgi:hypothetical protein
LKSTAKTINIFEKLYPTFRPPGYAFGFNVNALQNGSSMAVIYPFSIVLNNTTPEQTPEGSVFPVTDVC